MVRIAGVDVPDRKRAHIALRSIYGVGPVIAAEILEKAGIDPDMSPRMNELDEAQVDRIRVIVDQEYMTEGDLRRDVNQNIRRLIEIGPYRGSSPPQGPAGSTGNAPEPMPVPARVLDAPLPVGAAGPVGKK